MGKLLEVTFSNLPECWQTCGTCADGEIEVIEVLVQPGERVMSYEPLIAWEASKTTLELGAPVAGTVVEIFVEEGDVIEIDEPLLLLEVDEAC